MGNVSREWHWGIVGEPKPGTVEMWAKVHYSHVFELLYLFQGLAPFNEYYKRIE